MFRKLKGLFTTFISSLKNKDIPLSKKLSVGLGEYYEFFLYIIVGVLTTVVNLIVYYVLLNAAGVDPYTSTAVAWIVAMVFAFFVNKIWVFKDSDWSFGHALYQFAAFAAARLISFGLEELIMFLGIEICHINANVVKIPTQIIVVLVNYVASKLIIFRKKKKSDGSAGTEEDDPGRKE